ncbi:MAG: hypothetical protein Q7S92_01665 [Candidatus Diapherotrites archaeon]|nr:hypothetical protein [Candidatus Diapherotrites archaeon]
MFKYWVLFLFCLILAASTLATVEMVEPKPSNVLANTTITLGSAQPGESVKLVLTRGLGRNKWQDVRIDALSLPSGWTYEKQIQDQSFIVWIKVPSTANLDSYNLKVIVSSELLTESFNALLLVKDDLLTVSMTDLLQSTQVGESGTFKVSFQNNSIAAHNLKISSDLPSQWFAEQTLEILPGEFKQIELSVTTRSYGTRDFSFTLESTLNNSKKVFPATLTIHPTLKSKFSAVFYGFPFLSLSLLPYYLIDGFLSLVQ